MRRGSFFHARIGASGSAARARAMVESYGECLLAGALVLAVLLIGACCAAKAAGWDFFRGGRRGEGFIRGMAYRPACGAHWLEDRIRECRGQTTGEMPSIEDTQYMSWLPCCPPPTRGVPPPTLQQ